MSDNNSFADILQTYQCPFETDPLLLCQYYDNHTEGGVCPFGHQVTAITAGVQLAQLPSYHCTNYLIGDCINPLTESNSSSRPLTRCKDGLHLTAKYLAGEGKELQEMLVKELLDVDSRLEEKEEQEEELLLNSALLLDSTQFQEEEPLPSAPDCGVTICSICQNNDTVVVFGLLKDCDHSFCAGCILQWHVQQANYRKSCPVCRVPFDRVLLWSSPKLPSPAHRSTLFELQSRCDHLAAGQTFEVNDLQEMMERLALGGGNCE